MRLAIIIPVLNDAEQLAGLLATLQPARRAGHTVIVIDGGSRDASPVVAQKHADQLIQACRGRASQMNAGAQQADADILLFLHADSRVDTDAIEVMLQRLQADARWGWFHVRLSGRGPLLRVIEFFMNLRSRVTSIATGDQGLFVERELFFEAGRYPDIELMEDIALCKTLRRLARPACIPETVISSSRRWESAGILSTVLKMWWLRLMYFAGVSPRRLNRMYYR
jgi:rSAM/selenodomain-associated transferase 2